MKKFLRYAACLLVTFLAAAYALSWIINAFVSLDTYVWLIQKTKYWQHGVSEFFVWDLLPVVLCLWVAVIAWKLRK